MSPTTPTPEGEHSEQDLRVPLLVLGAGLLVFFPAAGIGALTARGVGRFARIPALTLGLTLLPLTVLLAVLAGAPDLGAMLTGTFTAWKGLLGADSVHGADALLTAGGLWALWAGLLAGTAWTWWAQRRTDNLRLNAWTWWTVRRLHARIARGTGFTDGCTLGVVDDNPAERVVVTARTANGHLLVTGATGAGKTQGLLSQLVDAAEQHNPIVYLDLKGGPDVPTFLAGLAAQHGVPFQHFCLYDATDPYLGPSANGPAGYNPAGSGDATRRKDLLTKACGSTVEFYKNMTSDYVQIAFAVLLAADAIGTDSAMGAISKVMDPRALQKVARDIPSTHTLHDALNRKVNEFVDGMKNREFMSSLKTFQTYLGLFMHSNAGPFITADGNVIDFADVDRRNGIVCFSLNSSLYPDQASRLATLIVEDITTYAGTRFGQATSPFRLVVDEFAVIDSTNLLGLVSRGREAGMCVTLATQTLADLEKDGAQFRSQVINNVAGFIVFRTNSEADAAIYSGLTGDLAQASGYGVPWQAFQNLEQGHCYFINKTPAARKKAGRTEKEQAVTLTRVIRRYAPAVPQYEVVTAHTPVADATHLQQQRRLTQYVHADWLTEPLTEEDAVVLEELTRVLAPPTAPTASTAASQGPGDAPGESGFTGLTFGTVPDNSPSAGPAPVTHPGAPADPENPPTARTEPSGGSFAPDETLQPLTLAPVRSPGSGAAVEAVFTPPTADDPDPAEDLPMDLDLDTDVDTDEESHIRPVQEATVEEAGTTGAPVDRARPGHAGLQVAPDTALPPAPPPPRRRR